jgi:oligo-1,6-glucosidase
VVKRNADVQKILNAIYIKGRDNARTPMQWNNEENAGFTTGTPWIKVNPNYKEINVKQAQEDPNSILHYYKKLIQLRKQNLTIVYGNYVQILEEHPEIYSYLRCLDDDRLLVILNFSGEMPVFNLPEEIICKDKELLISNYDVDVKEELKGLKLRPYEARVYRLK